MNVRYVIPLLAACLSMPANGQPEEFPDNPGGQAQINQRTDQVKAGAMEAWRAAMEGLDYPRILFAFGLSDGSPERALGRGLRPDEAAFTEALASSVRAAIIQAEPDTEIIDAASLDASKVRAARSLSAAGGAQDAIDALLASEDADFAVVFEFVQLTSDTYRVLGRIIDARRGRRYDTGAYEVATINHPHLQRTGIAIFNEVAQTMQLIAGRRFASYAVQIRGDSSLARTMRDFGDAVEGLEFVHDKSVRFRLSDGWYTSSVRYDGGALELAVDLQDLFEEQFRVRSQVAFADGGVLLTTYGTLHAPKWRVLVDSQVEDAEGVRQGFRGLYEEAGRPRVAILFNEIETVERETSPHPDPEATPDYETRLTQHASPLADSFETELAAVMMNAGVDLMNGAELRGSLRRQLLLDRGRAPDGLVREAEIEEALRQMNDLEMFVIGRLDPDPAGGGLATSRMTFRAFTRESNRMLGVSTWPSKEATRDPDYGVDPENETDIARFVAGSILDAYYRNHLRSGNSIDVIVEGAASFRQVQMIADSFETVVPGVISVPNPSFGSGEGRFTVRYEGSYADLHRGLQEVLGSLMIDTITDQATQDVLRVRASPLPESP